MGAVQSPTSRTRRPHGNLDELFFATHSAKESQPQTWTQRISSSSSSWKAGQKDRSEQILRVARINDVYWCSEPLKEAGVFQDLSPRTSLRLRRKLEGKVGPSSSEVGHSFVVLSVLVHPTDPESHELRPELWRVSWGLGIVKGTNLVIQEDGSLPPARIMGDRQERHWPATCTPAQLLEMLKKWDGREYDVNPKKGRNCHHFAQDLLQTCTANRTGYAGYAE